jgi:hypothetical protein
MIGFSRLREQRARRPAREDNPFQFDWPVDQQGHSIQKKEGDGRFIATMYSIDVVRRRGGPRTFYRPLEDHPGLWRECADSCTSRDSIVAFADKYGLLTDNDETTVDDFLDLAARLRAIANHLDSSERDKAAIAFAVQPQPFFAAGIRRDKKGKLVVALNPRTLSGALLFQACEAITGDFKFRKCKQCSRWFRMGTGAGTLRKLFCSNRCRVAWSRRKRRSE